MRLNYYMFPENTPEEVRLAEGCSVILKSGSEIWVDSIPDERRPLVDQVNDILGPCKVSIVKRLMRQYGGSGFTEHYDRDGGLFEVTDITLKGNNTEFQYNHHL